MPASKPELVAATAKPKRKRHYRNRPAKPELAVVEAPALPTVDPAKLPAALAMLARIDAAFAFDLSPMALSEHGIKARPATLRSVLVAIAHYDGGRGAWATIATLMAKTGIGNRRTMCGALAALVRLGAIGKRDLSQNRAGGRFASHTYYFRPTPPRRVSQ